MQWNKKPNGFLHEHISNHCNALTLHEANQPTIKAVSVTLQETLKAELTSQKTPPGHGHILSTIITVIHNKHTNYALHRCIEHVRAHVDYRRWDHPRDQIAQQTERAYSTHTL